MNVRVPVSKPVGDDAGEQQPRGGVEVEELRRIQQRAERYIADQAGDVEAAMTHQELEQQLALHRQREIMEARAVAARSATLRAEGTLRLVLSIAGGTVGGLVLGHLLFGGPKK